MAERVSWTRWEAWQDLWSEWVRIRHGEKNIAMEQIQFIDLFNYFVRQAKALGMGGYEVDVRAFLDPTLTYEENKKILAEIMRVPPTEKDYEAMYSSYKAELESEVQTQYPEVYKAWQERVKELERDVERLPKVEREREKFKRLSEETARELEETKRRIEQEKTALERKIVPVKLRILQSFREGIMDYIAGSIIETRDLDWAVEKIQQGYATREAAIGVITPTPPPPAVKAKLSDDEIATLWEEFQLYARQKGMVTPQVYRDRFLLEIGTAETYDMAAKRGRNLVDIIQKEMAPPTPPAEVVPPEVRTRFLDWTRRWVAPEAGRKAISLHPKDWLLTKGLTWGAFLKKSAEERKALMDEYERLVREER